MATQTLTLSASGTTAKLHDITNLHVRSFLSSRPSIVAFAPRNAFHRCRCRDDRENSYPDRPPPFFLFSAQDSAYSLPRTTSIESITSSMRLNTKSSSVVNLANLQVRIILTGNPAECSCNAIFSFFFNSAFTCAPDHHHQLLNSLRRHPEVNSTRTRIPIRRQKTRRARMQTSRAATAQPLL